MERRITSVTRSMRPDVRIYEVAVEPPFSYEHCNWLDKTYGGHRLDKRHEINDMAAVWYGGIYVFADDEMAAYKRVTEMLREIEAWSGK